MLNNTIRVNLETQITRVEAAIQRGTAAAAEVSVLIEIEKSGQ